jgi:hypothetical protein
VAFADGFRGKNKTFAHAYVLLPTV